MTNLLSTKGLKNIVYYNGDIIVSDGYGNTKSYRINLTSYSISEIPVGGGDIDIY